MNDQPFVDTVAPILSGEPTINDEQRADLYDTFHNSKDPNELVQKLKPLVIPDDLKQRLYDEKKKMTPILPPLDQTAAIMTRMSKMDPAVLDLAESHPNVLKAMAAAAAPAKGSESASGASKAPSKGNTPAEGKGAAAPTPDLPATPAGHALVKASDGGMYHIPHANIDQAKSIDPKLTVLHVEP